MVDPADMQSFFLFSFPLSLSLFPFCILHFHFTPCVRDFWAGLVEMPPPCTHSCAGRCRVGRVSGGLPAEVGSQQNWIYSISILFLLILGIYSLAQ